MLSQLEKTVTKRHKRVGQGWSSGAGKYSGKGQKGQKARGSIPFNTSGGQMLMSKGLPMLRGKLKNKPRWHSFALSIAQLESAKQVKDGATITTEFLVEKGLVKKTTAKTHKIKIVGQGTLTKKLTVSVPATQSAIEKIEHAGGTVSQAIRA